MKKTKEEWITLFRKEADSVMPLELKQTDRNKKSNVINNVIKQFSKNVPDREIKQLVYFLSSVWLKI